MAAKPGDVIIPRNFKLLEEVSYKFYQKVLPNNSSFHHFIYYLIIQLEHSEKGTGDMSVSMGLVDPDDIFLSEWNGSILGPHGVSIDIYIFICQSLLLMNILFYIDYF